MKKYNNRIEEVIYKYVKEFKEKIEILEKEAKFYEFSLLHAGETHELGSIVYRFGLTPDDGQMKLYHGYVNSNIDMSNEFYYMLINRSRLKKYLSEPIQKRFIIVKNVIWVSEKICELIPTSFIYNISNYRLYNCDDVPFYLLKEYGGKLNNSDFIYYAMREVSRYSSLVDEVHNYSVHNHMPNIIENNADGSIQINFKSGFRIRLSPYYYAEYTRSEKSFLIPGNLI